MTTPSWRALAFQYLEAVSNIRRSFARMAPEARAQFIAVARRSIQSARASDALARVEGERLP